MLVECALQERHWNAYYGLLATKLATHSKSHKVGCLRLWDILHMIFGPWFRVNYLGFRVGLESLVGLE